VEQRERLDELELVVQVVLEPEDDALRLEELTVAAFERGEDRRAAPPPALRQERRPGAQQPGAGARRHRALVQDVLPRQHGAAESRLPERVAGALAVRDVQHAATVTSRTWKVTSGA
jgi:hypothetical protein